jgi:hypothetical protein
MWSRLCDCLARQSPAHRLLAVLDHAGWRYGDAGNLGLSGVTALAMVMSMPEAHQSSAARGGGVIVLILSLGLAAIIAVFAPRHALWTLMLNALPVLVYRKSRDCA